MTRARDYFGELTTEIAGSPTDRIAIFLDGRELISPVVTQPITSGTAIIQGKDFTIERVRDILLLLETNSLPVPIILVQERTPIPLPPGATAVPNENLPGQN